MSSANVNILIKNKHLLGIYITVKVFWQGTRAVMVTELLLRKIHVLNVNSSVVIFPSQSFG